MRNLAEALRNNSSPAARVGLSFSELHWKENNKKTTLRRVVFISPFSSTPDPFIVFTFAEVSGKQGKAGREPLPTLGCQVPASGIS